MDIVEATSEFQDWEVLHPNRDSESATVTSHEGNHSFLEIDSELGLLQANYFSLDAHKRYAADLDDDKSAASDHPSWIDPGLDENPTRYLNNHSGEFWSDSSSERSQDRKFTDLEGRNDMDFHENYVKEGIGEILEQEGEKAANSGKFSLDSIGCEQAYSEIDDFAKHSRVDGDCDVNLHGRQEILGEEKNGNEKSASGGTIVDNVGSRKTDEPEKRSIVWWKMPVEILKYCVFRMSPAWAVSVAAAVLGFVILGRRLYKTKKKARALEIKVAVDDKKITQVMSRAARLNEAFSIVKRVPVIRPSLPAVGTTTTWPVVNLR
jgi:hypothetical protein